MNLTYKQMAGQRLMVGFEGTKFNKNLMFLIDTIKVGGIILFSQNISEPKQLKDLIFTAQKYAESCGQPPLFVAIDQEGGEVARLKAPFTEFTGNPSMKDEKDAEYFAETTSFELKSVGINMNFAPVMDVALKSVQSIIAGRSFGNSPDWVSTLGVKVIDCLQNNNIMAVAKHFPGIGRTTADSHIKMPFLNTNLSDLEAFDFPPFAASVAHNVAGIMLSHILYKNIDHKWPASLSPIIAKNLLRDRMKFSGLVMTDDLDMGAIKKNYDIKTIIRQILSAEIDLILICHQGPDIENAFNEILRGYEKCLETKKNGEASVNRILEYKKKFVRSSF